MKLLYMYFKYRDNYKRIFEDGIEFNFDSETRFRCEGNVLSRSCKTHRGLYSL